MAYIEIFPRCSECGGLIREVTRYSGGSYGDLIREQVFYSSTFSPKFCQYCGARFNTILQYHPKRRSGEELRGGQI